MCGHGVYGGAKGSDVSGGEYKWSREVKLAISCNSKCAVQIIVSQ